MTSTRTKTSAAITWPWVPAAQQLPDDDISVLIALDDGEVWIGYVDAGTWRDTGATPLEVGRVTHWMHLPAAPGSGA